MKNSMLAVLVIMMSVSFTAVAEVEVTQGVEVLPIEEAPTMYERAVDATKDAVTVAREKWSEKVVPVAQDAVEKSAELIARTKQAAAAGARAAMAAWQEDGMTEVEDIGNTEVPDPQAQQ